MVKDPLIESLLKYISDYFESNPNDLDGAVIVAEEFCSANRIELKSLLDFSSITDSQEEFALAYVLSKVACNSQDKEVIILSHYYAGLALQSMGYFEAAEKEHQTTLEIDPNNLKTHNLYAFLLQEMGRFEDSENEYRIAVEIDSGDSNIHYNYGNLLKQMGRLEDAEKEYILALKINPNYFDVHYNYANLLKQKGRFEDAENEYKLALKKNPIHIKTLINYGNLLQEIGRFEEAEKEYKSAIYFNPKNANAHGAYGLLLFKSNKIKKSLKETKRASELFKEEGNKIMEHFSLAWINELISNKYYNEGISRKNKKSNAGGNFRKSGKYAFVAADGYIRASENAEGEQKLLYLTKGYTLKGRAEIRNLDFPIGERLKLKLHEILHRQSFAELRLITSGIQKAAENYKQVAELSAGKSSSCSACYSCMNILNEVLDFVNAATMQQKVPDLKEKVEGWNKELDSVEAIYEGSAKGTIFVHALRRMISSLYSFENFKTKGRLEFERNLNTCINELQDITNNIEGPLQEVIDKSAQQMKKCAMKWNLYVEATETEPLESGKVSLTVLISSAVRWIRDNLVVSIISGLVVAAVLAYFGLTA